jgi:3-methyladenine DNA glycosylase AlkD
MPDSAKAVSLVPTTSQAAAEARRALRKMARPAGDFNARQYFRDTGGLLFSNIGAARVRALARELHGRHQDRWTLDDATAFADRLIRDRHFEAKAVGIELLARCRRHFAPGLLSRWKRWLADGHSANWATTDAICGYLIGPLVVAHPRLAPRVAGWCRDRNMWVRRASAVGLLPLLRTREGLDLAYRVARTLHADREDLIQKAVGWMLREAGKVDRLRLERYLRANGRRIPRTTVRYAIERFPPAKRRRLLDATRQ